MLKTLQKLLAEVAAQHSHLCPRQVIGVRMGMLAAELLDIDLPQINKRLLVIVESDGCFADGVATATGATVGHRTMRVEDYGKVAACLRIQRRARPSTSPLPRMCGNVLIITPHKAKSVAISRNCTGTKLCHSLKCLMCKKSYYVPLKKKSFPCLVCASTAKYAARRSSMSAK